MPTVLVVGANRGLGLQFALQYLKKGCNVYGTHRKESAHEAKEVGLLLRLCTLTLRGCLLLESGAKTLTLDLGDEKSIQAAAEAFGDQPLDILINCAAAGNESPKWLDATPDEFMQRFKISSVGPFLTVKPFYPQLKKSGSSLVVNISSNAGSISQNASGGNLTYRTSKAALNMITVDLARELAPDKIALVAMSPEWVKTKMSAWTGPLEVDEAVTRMVKVIDVLDFSHTATFVHRDGHTVDY